MESESSERLKDVARIQKNADKAVEKFYQRGPFVLGLLMVLFAATVAGATWTTIIQISVSRHERDWNDLKTDNKVGIIEQVHALNDRVDLNRRQIRALNKKDFGYPDTDPEP